MKVKEISATANIAWSPEFVRPIYLVCGTSAQQLDASFNSSSVLEIYDLNSSNNSLDTKLVTKKNVPAKFNKILWSGSKQVLNQELGIIVGGCENSSVYLYSADKLLKNEDALLIALEKKHAGPVYALDFNCHQANLLATGSSDCEIIIWDVNNTSSPMSPGAKPNMTADVDAIAWNRQVEHIMASTYAGRCVVYDLRKSAPIIQIAESVSRIKARGIDWHPSVATQLILGCDDDSAPFSQVWDLRFAAAPLKTLEGHQRGVVASAWCTADPDLFLTSAKDNKILVWNPSGGEKTTELVGEFPSYNQFSFDVCWCPRDPSLVAAASVDATVSVYSVLGAGLPPAQNNKFSAIADSFPGMEMPVEAPPTAQPQSIYLKRPPKWFPKRCGARFGFGGRLVSWGAADRTVSVSQVVTEPEFVARSARLEQALSQTDLDAFCVAKEEHAERHDEKLLWRFIGATFDRAVRKRYLGLLGFDESQVAAKVRPNSLAASPDALADQMAQLGANGASDSQSSLDPSEQFEMIASAHAAAADADKPADELRRQSDVSPPPPREPLSLSVDEDPSGLVRHALLVGDLESAVLLCLDAHKPALALILAAHAGQQLFSKTRGKVLSSEPRGGGLAPLVRALVEGDLESVVSECSLTDWREALVAALTYASDDLLPSLLDRLGGRLEADGSPDRLHSAVLCYLCAGSLDKFVSCLSKTRPSFADGSPSHLLDLIEIMAVLERALTATGRSASLKEGHAASAFLCKYASLLASQGALSTAVSYLNASTHNDVTELRDRLYRALGYPTTTTNMTARARACSSSSHSALRRSSTPQSYQPQQYTPSVQAQQAQQGLMGPQTPFFASPPLAKPPGTFLHPTATVSPSVGGNPIPTPTNSMSTPNHFQPPAAPPPSVPPPSQISASALRRPGGSNRYIQDPIANSPSMFSPAAASPRQPIPHYPTYNPSPVAGMAPPTGGLPPGSAFAPEASEAVGSPMTPAAYDPNVPRGWNDPPPLMGGRKTKQQQQQQKKPGVGEAAAAAPTGLFVPEPPKTFQGFQSPYQGGMPVDTSQQGLSQGPGQMQTQAAPPPLPPKGPLPPEHQVIQEVFSRLRERGMFVTTNLSAKQRLEDLSSKMEVLYDKLREGHIAPNTVSGLHQIVDAAKSGDYLRALQLHAATVSSGNFSEMSQFMPAVKMLLTTCMQCQVFYH